MCHFYHNSSLSFSLSVPLLFPLFYPMCLFSISDLRLHLARDNLLNVYSDLVFRFHKKGTQENDEPSRVASQTWNLLHMDLLLAKWGNVTELKSRQVLDVRHSLSLSLFFILFSGIQKNECVFGHVMKLKIYNAIVFVLCSSICLLKTSVAASHCRVMYISIMHSCRWC